MRLAIIDYGAGNLHSIGKAFAAVGCDAEVSADVEVLRGADRLVLPGVGAFAWCMEGLKRGGFDEVVHEHVEKGKPLLGVCVGMQMLFEHSEEFGETPGLGLLRGRVRRFATALPVPHTGWNQVRVRAANPLFENINDDSFFYFVHSFYCETADSADAVGVTDYELEYASVVARDNIYGVQFHPEKSQATGLTLLGNFAKMD